METQYANESVQNFRMGDLTTCVYQFICDENENGDTKIIQYFIIHGLVL